VLIAAVAAKHVTRSEIVSVAKNHLIAWVDQDSGNQIECLL
jgi:hypothetical protein